MDLDPLASDRLGPVLQTSLHGDLTVERHKPKSMGSASVLIHQQGHIDYMSELGKEPLKIICGCRWVDATYEDLHRFLLFGLRDRTFGVDLGAPPSIDATGVSARAATRRTRGLRHEVGWAARVTHLLAIRVMHLLRHRRYGLGILEADESESTRLSDPTFLHHRTVEYYAVLRGVIDQGRYAVA